MDVTTYQTSIGFLPASRSGLTPAHWSVTHLCNRCFDYIATEELIAHAQIHAVGPSDREAFPSRKPSGTMATKQPDRCEGPIAACDDQHPPITTDHRRR